ncbi:RNA methyltransferase [Pseudochelatococcus contaminans]|uniref:tRNA G18 (Ribose-2'-O)-methylase SpoU n=1 Tax=Pseudochelatococcus contaminans TaxID=1538103 RepID=A0A7W6EJ12_9HYPH|nr:tRNA G18 (ribose-2'-O)-methylase SpoU [Pseudochelatococcus contaminans]
MPVAYSAVGFEVCHIDRPDDPRVEAYVSIRERDLVGREGRFIAEGETVLAVLLRQKLHAVESVFVLDKRLPHIAHLLQDVPATVPLYVASREVMDAVAGFPIHRGVLAVGRRREQGEAAAFLAALPERALVVGFVGLANHDNVGGIFRNAAAFGADAVLLDDTSCDPLYRKAIRVSVGGALCVPFFREASAHALVDLLTDAGFSVLALSPRGMDTLSALEPPRRAALLLGTEGPGLPDDVLARCRTVSIPMHGTFDSLNVATTSGIALHHLVSR